MLITNLNAVKDSNNVAVEGKFFDSSTGLVVGDVVRDIPSLEHVYQRCIWCNGRVVEYKVRIIDDYDGDFYHESYVYLVISNGTNRQIRRVLGGMNEFTKHNKPETTVYM